MSTPLKCPNPSCPYLFDPSGVPAGAVLACPQCGMRFTLGSPSAPPPAYGSPIGHAPAGSGYPSHEAPPSHEFAFSPDTPETKGDGTDRVRGRRSLGSQPRQSYQMVIMVGIAMTLLAGAGYTIYNRMNPKLTEQSTTSSVKDLNLAFEPPPAPWKQDENLRAKLGSGIFLVLARAEPDAFIAFGGRNYEERNARASELEDGIRSVTQSLFETVGIEKSYEGAHWLGLEAKRAYQFRGQERATGENISGEAFAVGKSGLGYWTVGWTAEKHLGQIAPELQTIRERFRLADPERQWDRQRSAISILKGDKLPYTLQDPDDFWKEDRTQAASDEDVQADLKRVAILKGAKGSDFKLHAKLVTYIIDAAGEPLDDARKYLETILNKDADVFGKTELSVVEERPTGDLSLNPVEKSAEVLRLRARNGNNVELMVIGATQVQGKVVFVCCSCKWPDREAFEQNFLATAGSLKAGD